VQVVTERVDVAVEQDRCAARSPTTDDVQRVDDAGAIALAAAFLFPRICAESRDRPVRKSISRDSSSVCSSSGRESGSTTTPSGLNWMKLRPPKVAAYWSCLPIGIFSLSISTWQARSAISWRSSARCGAPPSPDQRHGDRAGGSQAGAGRDLRGEEDGEAGPDPEVIDDHLGQAEVAVPGRGAFERMAVEGPVVGGGDLDVVAVVERQDDVEVLSIVVLTTAPPYLA